MQYEVIGVGDCPICGDPDCVIKATRKIPMTIRQTDLFDAPEAARLRDEGIDVALDADRVQLWKAKAQHWMTFRPKGYRFTADEIVAAVGLPDEGINKNNVVGAVVRSWASHGWIIKTGCYKPSTRKRRHASVQTVWEIV